MRLDERLSDFESVLLDAHVSRCLDCRDFAATSTWATNALRSAPLEEPQVSFGLAPQRQAQRKRRSGVLGGGSVAAVAALAVVALLHLSAGGTPTASAGLDRKVLDLKERQLNQLDASARLPARPVQHGVTAAREATLGAPAPASHDTRAASNGAPISSRLEVGL